MRNSLAIFVLILLSAACSTNTPLPDNQAPTIPASPVPSATPSSTASASPTASFTVKPSQTPLPTQTPSATPSPTPVLPVKQGTPFPLIDSQVITAGNATQIRELARYGDPVVKEWQLTADGSLLFLATTDGVKIYDVETLELFSLVDVLIRRWSTDSFSVSADGSRFGIVTRDAFQVYDIDGNLLVNWHPEILSGTTRVLISPDGKFASFYIYPEMPADQSGIDRDNWSTKIVFEISTGKQVQALADLKGWSFSFSPDGSYFGSRGWNFEIWRTQDWSQPKPVTLPYYAYGVVFLPNGRLAILHDQERVDIWDIETGKMVRQFSNLRYPLTVVYSVDGSKIAILDAGSRSSASKLNLYVWDLQDRKLLRTEHPSYFDQILITNTGETTFFQPPFERFNMESSRRSSDSRISLHPETSAMTLWNQQKVCEFNLHGETHCTSVDWPNWGSPEFSLHPFLILCEQGKIYQVQHTEGGRQVSVTQIGGEQPYTWSFQSDYYCYPHLLLSESNLLLCSSEQGSRLWDFDKAQLIRHWGNRVSSVQLGPESRYFAMLVSPLGWSVNTADIYISVIEVSTGKEIYKVSRNNSGFVFFPAGDRFAHAFVEDKWNLSPSTVRIDYVDLIEKRVYQSYKLTDLNPATITSYWDVTALVVSPEAVLLAAGFNDGSIYLVELESGTVIHHWLAHEDEIIDLKFAQNGKQLLSSGKDGFLRIWGIIP
jgi:WD40 repeat protein